MSQESTTFFSLSAAMALVEDAIHLGHIAEISIIISKDNARMYLVKIK